MGTHIFHLIINNGPVLGRVCMTRHDDLLRIYPLMHKVLYLPLCKIAIVGIKPFKASPVFNLFLSYLLN